MHFNNFLHFEVVTMVLFMIFPWPGSVPPRSPCCREKSSLVRKVVAKKWVPILEKMGASLPLYCPLHPARDIYFLQESRKRHLASEWTCGFCGSTFYQESQLDLHMEEQHPDKLKKGDDAVCLADYCDILRCEVLQERLMELEELTPTATALDLWHKPLLISSSRRARHEGNRGAVEKVGPRILMRTSPASTLTKEVNSGSYSFKVSSEHPDKSSHPVIPQNLKEVEDEKTNSIHNDCTTGGETCKKQMDSHNESENSSQGPSEVPIHHLHDWRDTCNEEHLAELRVKCQQLIQLCVSGLVLNLTLSQVRDVEVAFHRSVCWYLTCDRYWEAGMIELPDFPWGIFSAFVLLLTLGVSLCYYIVWVLFESSQDSAVCTPVVCIPAKFQSQINSSQMGVNITHLTSNPAITQGPSCGNSLQKSGALASRARFCATESESECRDSGFNEGGLYPEYESPQDFHSDANSYRSRHYSEDSRMSSFAPEESRYYVQEERVYNYATSFTPNYEQRRLRRNRYNYLDDFDTYSETEGEGLDSNGGLSRERSDSFIYVSYPPEIKKRFQENR